MLEICVLISVGRHPRSGAPRRSDVDSRALSLAIRARNAQQVGKVTAVHAGAADEQILRDYAGLGLDAIVTHPLPAEADPLPTLLHYIAETKPSIILTGAVAEVGEASGFLPYALAAAAGMSITAPITAIDLQADGTALIEEALPAGYRNKLVVTWPFVAPVAIQAPAPLPSVFARSRSARIGFREPLPMDFEPVRTEFRPESAKPTGSALSAPASVAQRKAALLKGDSKGQLIDAPPPESARQIWTFLKDRGLVELGFEDPR